MSYCERYLYWWRNLHYWLEECYSFKSILLCVMIFYSEHMVVVVINCYYEWPLFFNIYLPNSIKFQKSPVFFRSHTNYINCKNYDKNFSKKRWSFSYEASQVLMISLIRLRFSGKPQEVRRSNVYFCIFPFINYPAALIK